MVDIFTLEIFKYASNIISFLTRVPELAIAIFLTSQLVKPNSNYKSAYFVILNIGYIEDLINFLIWCLQWCPWLGTAQWNITSILFQWHNIFFIIVWNAILVFNRCTALAFSLKHERVSLDVLIIKLFLGG